MNSTLPQPNIDPATCATPMSTALARPAEDNPHLRTDHLRRDLSRRALSGGAITATAQAVKFLLNLAGTIGLARLLSPQDFGLVAMAGALMPILRTFREGGLSTATVQSEGVTHAQVSNLFWINLLLGGTIAAIGAALAPAVAWFYDDQRLAIVTVLLSTSFLLSGSAVQHVALLNRQMRFMALAATDVSSAVVGFAVGMLLAWRGCGYWSLVGMQLASAASETFLIWFLSGWKPQVPRRKAGTRPLLQFGASMSVYIFLRRLASGLDVILLGRFYGAYPVGIYSRGQALLLRPLDQFINPFDTVFIPLLSRLQGEPQRYRLVFLEVYGGIALLSFTFAGLLSGLSHPLVLVLLGEKWTAVIPVFSWLTVAALHIPLSYSAMWLLTTQGRSKDLLLMSIVVPSITVLSVVTGLPFGVRGLAISVSLIGLFVRMPVQYYITGRSGPVGRRDLWSVFARHLPLWIAVAGSTLLVQHYCRPLPPTIQLLIGGTSGLVVAYLAALSSPQMRRELQYILAQLDRVRLRRRAAA